MQRQIRTISGVVAPAVLLLAIFVGVPQVQSQQSTPGRVKVSNAPAPTASGDPDSTATQDQLIKLLRLSPTLTTVVSRDPTLLADKDYVARNNPELAKFLVAHPEVVRNPDFYLFSHLPGSRGHQDMALMRSIWPDLVSAPQQIFVPGSPQAPEQVQDSTVRELMNGPFFAWLCFLSLMGVFLWMLRMFLDNRRWNRIFRLQTEVHSKLIDRFGNNQELLTYMGTEAGKRFLEAAPIPMDFKVDRQPMPNAVARVLTPLQIGVVLTLLGIGLLLLRHGMSELATPLLFFGIVVLMPGLGFILSAGIAWYLAGRLELLPESAGGSRKADHDASERQ